MSVEKVSKDMLLCISCGGTIYIVIYVLWNTTKWRYSKEMPRKTFMRRLQISWFSKDSRYLSPRELEKGHSWQRIYWVQRHACVKEHVTPIEWRQLFGVVLRNENREFPGRRNSKVAACWARTQYIRKCQEVCEAVTLSIWDVTYQSLISVFKGLMRGGRVRAWL